MKPAPTSDHLTYRSVVTSLLHSEQFFTCTDLTYYYLFLLLKDSPSLAYTSYYYPATLTCLLLTIIIHQHNYSSMMFNLSMGWLCATLFTLPLILSQIPGSQAAASASSMSK